MNVVGCLMIIAWMMSASLAIIMSRYYKPMWPNDRLCGHRVWFAVSHNRLICVKVLMLWPDNSGHGSLLRIMQIL